MTDSRAAVDLEYLKLVLANAAAIDVDWYNVGAASAGIKKEHTVRRHANQA